MACLILPARRPTVSRNVCASVSLSGECIIVLHYDSGLNFLMAWKKFPLVLITVVSQMTSPGLIKRVVPAFNVSSHWSLSSLVAFSCLPHSISCRSPVSERGTHPVMGSLHMVKRIFKEALGAHWAGLPRCSKWGGSVGLCLPQFILYSLLRQTAPFLVYPSSYFCLVSHCLQSMADISVKWESNDHAYRRKLPVCFWLLRIHPRFWQASSET